MTIGQCGGCSYTVSKCIVSLWKAFRKLLLILTNCAIRTNLSRNAFNICLIKVLWYGSKTWPFVTVQQLVTADSGMIRWICAVSLKDRIPMTDLLLRLGLSSISEMLWQNRLRFHGHLLCVDDDKWPKKAMTHYVDGKQPRCRPRNRSCDVIRVHMNLLNLTNDDANNRTV